MLTLTINHIVFLCILVAHLFCRKKIGKEVFDKKTSYFFVGLYVLYFYCMIRFSRVIINNEMFCIEMMLYFILAFVLNVKQCAIIVISCAIIFFRFRYLYNNYSEMLLDIIVMFLYITLGILCRKRIYINSYPKISTSVSYSIVLTTIYAFVFFVGCLIFEKKIDITQNYILMALTVRILKAIPALATSLIIIRFFNESKNVNDKNLIQIFVSKYHMLITFFTIFAVAFCIIANFIFVKLSFGKVLELNYTMAKNDLIDSYGKYGEDFLEADQELLPIFNSWVIDALGAVYLLDKDLNLVNDFTFLDTNEYFDKREFDINNFKEICSYEKDEVVTYSNNNKYYMAKYDSIGQYYLLVFLSYSELLSIAFVPSVFSLFMIIMNILIVFALVYLLFKKFVVNNLWVVNKKLDEITAGNYDVIFTDRSSNEFRQLSYSINHTVLTLKKNIETIENKNREELSLARRIQISQLPINTDVTIGYSGYGLNIPAEDVGGDFYDDFEIDDLRRIILIADVSGKGIPGALFMMKAKHTIINLAKQHDNMEVIFEEANKVLCENNPTIMFVTCFAIMINIETGNISMINAGHNKPILIRENDGNKECNYIEMEPSHILGIDNTSKYIAKEIKLSIGDKIILYTDGVNEAKNINKDEYGTKRFLEAVKNIKSNNPKEICNEIVSNVKAFADKEPQSDDITIYCLKYNGNNNVLTFKATFNELDKGKMFVDKFTKAYNIDINIARNLKVVYDEIACNIISYAYKDTIGDITMKLNFINNETIEMIFIDSGIEFNPLEYDNNSDERTADDKLNGGMGILFCKNMMDECIYSRENGCNIFKMYKKVISTPKI